MGNLKIIFFLYEEIIAVIERFKNQISILKKLFSSYNLGEKRAGNVSFHWRKTIESLTE